MLTFRCCTDTCSEKSFHIYWFCIVKLKQCRFYVILYGDAAFLLHITAQGWAVLKLAPVCQSLSLRALGLPTQTASRYRWTPLDTWQQIFAFAMRDKLCESENRERQEKNTHTKFLCVPCHLLTASTSDCFICHTKMKNVCSVVSATARFSLNVYRSHFEHISRWHTDVAICKVASCLRNTKTCRPEGWKRLYNSASPKANIVNTLCCVHTDNGLCTDTPTPVIFLTERHLHTHTKTCTALSPSTGLKSRLNIGGEVGPSVVVRWSPIMSLGLWCSCVLP